MFLCFTFFSWFPVQWQGCRSGHIWLAPRVTVYSASGLLLGRPPLLSPFPHSPWDSRAPSGTGFTISAKSSNSTPRQLSLLPLFQEQRDPTVWTDGMTAGRAKMALPIQIKLKSLSVSTPKTTSPQAWGTMRSYAYYKFLKKTRATN
jgi:hypothetical protein